MNLEKEYKATMTGLQTYMTSKDDVPIQAVLRHQKPKVLSLYPRKLRNTFRRLEQQMTSPMIMGRQPHEDQTTEAEIQGRLQKDGDG